MSTFIKDNAFSVENNISNEVSLAQKESLGEFVKRVRSEKRLSLVAVRENSGNDIATSYISRIENGEEIEIGLRKLQALAKGLRVTEAEILALAGIEVDEKNIVAERFSRISDGYSFLTEQEKYYLEPLLVAVEFAIERSEQYREHQAKSESPVQKSKSGIPKITYQEAKADDDKKTEKGK